MTDTKPRDAGEVAADCIDLCYVQRDWRGRLEPMLTTWRREIEAAARAEMLDILEDLEDECLQWDEAAHQLTDHGVGTMSECKRITELIRARFGGGE